LDIIHHISILDFLISSGIRSVDDWIWYKQLTFKQNTSNNMVEIFMANTNFEYTFEYQGNSAKLVYTPLTDKCFLTLTQAMSMGLGGNPYGPAGTGKT
jgi:dynein heavy chain 2